MNNQTDSTVTDGGKRPREYEKLEGTTDYRGHMIEYSTLEFNQQIQDVRIDGKPVGYVAFPNSAVRYAVNLIDARLPVLGNFIGIDKK